MLYGSQLHLRMFFFVCELVNEHPSEKRTSQQKYVLFIVHYLSAWKLAKQFFNLDKNVIPKLSFSSNLCNGSQVNIWGPNYPLKCDLG